MPTATAAPGSLSAQLKRERAERAERDAKDAKSGKGGGEGRGRKRHPIAYGMWFALIVVVTIGVLVVAVFPTRSWLQQRSAVTEAERKLAVIETENARLDARITALQDPAEIERVAREKYGLVKPGETAFAILPAPAASVLPAGFPFNLLPGLLDQKP